MIMNNVTADWSKSVPAFYAGQSIFFTGSTGFLGKVFIEKTLRSCPDIRQIFLLIRPKKESDINKRLEEIISLPIFDKLRNEQPSCFKKLIPIAGNTSEKQLGMSQIDIEMLIEEVTIVVHAAADVKFNNTLQHAIFANTRSVREICILAQGMKKLITLLYVSTAYSQVNKPVIKEEIYPPLADWRKMIEIAESSDTHTLNILTAKCLGVLPNTYVFTKNLAEGIIQEYSSSLPCTIVRPSMVVSAMKEPLTGWLDTFYSTVGIFIGSVKGVLRVAYVDENMRADVIPVDFVIKALLCAIWKRALTNFTPDSEKPLVFNCTSHNLTNYTLRQYSITTLNVSKEVPFEGVIWKPRLTLTPSPIMYYIWVILLHMLPAMIIDLILKLSGQRPMLVNLQRRVYTAGFMLYYFVTNQWEIHNTNLMSTICSLSFDDKEAFEFNGQFDLDEFIRDILFGAKRYLLHEDMNQQDAARKSRDRIILFVTILETIIILAMLWYTYRWIILS